jgi:RNA-directed DNA polymerase
MGKGVTVQRSPHRKHMQIRQADQHMQTSLRGIAKRAKENPKHRFGNLYSLLNEANLHWCFRQMNRKAAPGIDGVDWQSFESNLTENVREIVTLLKEKRYKAKLIRRRHIPKPDGKQRPLGIPVIGDKLVQTAAAKILSVIFEQDFLSFSHGYRRGKGPQKAALHLGQQIHRGPFGWVFDADIKGFFDNIDHDWLMRMLEHRIADQTFLGLIRKWLKAGILEEDGHVVYPVTGTPQGGVISAVLANIYLHFALDLWFEKVVKARISSKAIIMRFADDFVCCFQNYHDLRRFSNVISRRLGKFNLELSRSKTRVIRFTRFETKRSKSFTFLGFEYRWGLSRKGKPLVRLRTSKKKFKLAMQAMKMWIRSACKSLSTAKFMMHLRPKLQGHYNYYGVCGNIRMLNAFYRQTIRMVYKWLNRRSQRKSCNWRGFSEMLKHYRIPRPRIIGYWD